MKVVVHAAHPGYEHSQFTFRGCDVDVLFIGQIRALLKIEML